jgi:hypothetical protein
VPTVPSASRADPLLNRPHDPAGEEDQGHGQCQIEIGIGPAKQGLRNPEAVRVVMTPPVCANPWNEAYPVGSEDENENRREEPERPLDQMRPDDAFQKVVQTLN